MKRYKLKIHTCTQAPGQNSNAVCLFLGLLRGGGVQINYKIFKPPPPSSTGSAYDIFLKYSKIDFDMFWQLCLFYISISNHKLYSYMLLTNPILGTS